MIVCLENTIESFFKGPRTNIELVIVQDIRLIFKNQLYTY